MVSPKGQKQLPPPPANISGEENRTAEEGFILHYSFGLHIPENFSQSSKLEIPKLTGC